MAKLFIVNLVPTFIWFGIFELRLHLRGAQAPCFKFNAKWPSENPSSAFFFKSENVDSFIWTVFSAIPTWTGVQVFVFWVFANGWVPWLTVAENPIHVVCLALAVPIIHQAHFLCIHRLIHTPLLCRHVHSVRHNSVNPSPFSCLAMHPVEHLLHLGAMVWHMVIPSKSDDLATSAAFRRLRGDPGAYRIREDRGR